MRHYYSRLGPEKRIDRIGGGFPAIFSWSSVNRGPIIGNYRAHLPDPLSRLRISHYSGIAPILRAQKRTAARKIDFAKTNCFNFRHDSDRWIPPIVCVVCKKTDPILGDQRSGRLVSPENVLISRIDADKGIYSFVWIVCKRTDPHFTDSKENGGPPDWLPRENV